MMMISEFVEVERCETKPKPKAEQRRCTRALQWRPGTVVAYENKLRHSQKLACAAKASIVLIQQLPAPPQPARV